jgi:MraZ protein
VLPEDLKDHASITDEVAFVGLGTMFQLWEPGRFNRHRAEARERSRRSGATLPSAGPR